MRQANTRSQNCTRFLFIFDSAFRSAGSVEPTLSPAGLVTLGAAPSRSSCQRWTRTHTGPYNEKNQPFGRTPPSAARTEADHQFAQNRFPHEGQPAATGAQTPRAL